MDADERALLAETFRKTMTAASGQVLDLALTQLGWPDLLAEQPDVAIPMVFGLLGETGAQAPLLNDVLLHVAGRRAGGTLPLPYTGGSARAARSGVTVDLRVQPDAASLQAETVSAMAAFIAAWTRTTRTPQHA